MKEPSTDDPERVTRTSSALERTGAVPGPAIALALCLTSVISVVSVSKFFSVFSVSMLFAGQGWKEPPRVPATFAAGWKYPTGGQASTATKAMVASSGRLAAEAGAEVLRSGGNAIDAAVAVGYALAVTYPEAGNIGGGGYMMIRMADGRVAALDYREMAPGSATRNMFLDSAGRLTRFSVSGRAAAGVPGVVAGLAEAHRRFGSMSLARAMAPAITLASAGFTVDDALASSVSSARSRIAQYDGAMVFLPGGDPLVKGSRLVQPQLAETLRLIARDGPRAFYRGRIARDIVAEMRGGCAPGVSERDRAANGCGIITTADLASYKPRWREAIRTMFRGHSLISMPPSSSGGITLGETLNILDRFPSLPPFGSPAYLHLVTSAFQRSFIDRNTLLGDADFVRIPSRQLTSRVYSERLRRTINANRATPTSSIVMPSREGTETTHYSIVDAAGNAVSTTTTLNGLYGSGVFVSGAGFFMNNTMDDFSAKSGVQNQFALVQGEANAIAPRKRALSAMTPVIVLDPGGSLYMILGARGGPRIITSVAQVLINVIEHRMTLADAMSAPRIHYQALPDTVRYDAEGLDASAVTGLSSMGYALTPQGYIGGSVVAIKRVPDGWEGMDDPRGSGGGAVGY